ncbi:FecR family protein [Solitalea canadensis]|uniref:Fe2+-dicitrate sensor, membrane component n=1 Tax=Solitalea canadensis (strain ATCC 29591 / DSM 3403 / JCM 21819 / LMG 8368 / NBRC 15130 / NCIMB 12057 / USAM 9D) TaxID=929556 RepID=H8KP75_SOLCM|nr:FecR domain-containing protein [Solitalea canadensis]AFD05712.1 Fe2+-dicitrate sensor, membrane component [Solitalea canadensis DSM 3403]
MLNGKEYSAYKVEDFLGDESFVNWVKSNADNSDWQQVLAENPSIVSFAEEARKWVLQLNIAVAMAPFSEQVRFKEKLKLSIEKAEQNTKVRQLRIAVQRIAAVFVAIMVIAAAIGTYNYYRYEHLSTAYGQNLKITLPDQSEVVLNANSSIKYKKTWNSNEIREVWVEGEAYFDVKHLNKNEALIKDAERFVVHTDDLDVQVLGTSFNVNNRRHITKVVLSSGKISVAIKEKNKSIFLTPGTALEYNPHENLIVKKTIKAEDESAWKQSKLVFNKLSLTEVAKIIEDNYGYKVSIEGEELKNRKLTGTLSIQSEEILFAAIQSILKVEIIKDKESKTLIIRDK